MKKILLFVGLVLVACAAIFFASRDDSGAFEALEPGKQAASKPVPAGRELPGLSTAAGDSGLASAERMEVASQGNLSETDKTRVLRGRALFSFALPSDEEIYVMSLSRPCSRQDIYRSRGSDEPGLAGSVWNAVQGEGRLLEQESGGSQNSARVLSFVQLAADGTFQLGIPEETKVVHLALTGRYVFSHGSTKFNAEEDQQVVLTGQLGAWITGKLRAPLGAGEDVSLEGITVTLMPDMTAGFSARELQGVAYGIKGAADASGKFEFRSVPIEYAHSFLASSEDFGAQLRDGAEGMRLISGEHFNFEVRMEEGATLRGWVLDEFLNPVTGGLVEVQSPGTVGKVLGVLRETIIEEDGSFELKHVATGFRLNLTAAPAGYQVGRHKLEDSLRDGQLLDEILIEVTKGKSLRGVVKFADGSPTEDVKVVLQPDYAALDPALIGSVVAAFRGGEAKTNGEGEFELLGLAKGPFKVNAETVVEEGSLAGDWSGVVAGLEGDEQDVEIVLEKLSLIPGIVTTEGELPIGDLEVRVTLKGSGGIMGIGEESRVVNVDAPGEEGEFEVTKVRTGIWQVALKAEGFAWTEVQDVKVPVAEGVPVPLFVLVPSSSVSGVVYDNSGATVSGAVVTLDLGIAGMVDAAKAGGAPSTHSDHEGKFHLKDVAPGAKSIHATLVGFAASEAISFDFLAGEQIQDVSLTLRLGGTIVGEVFGPDGEPAEGRSIIVRNVPSYSSQIILESNRDGEFRAENLEAGRWQVVSMKNVMNGEFDVEGGEGMGDLLSDLLTDMVTVVDGEEVFLTLGSPPTDPLELSGLVLADGLPVSGATVVLRPGASEGLGGMLMTTTDSQGKFQRTLAERGGYLVTVQTGMATGLQNSIEFLVEIPEGVEQHSITIELPMGGISGTVWKPDGKPATGCRVTLHVDEGIAYGSFLGGQYTEMLTDKEGKYSISNLRPGTYSLAAGGATMGGLLGDDGSLGRQVQGGLKVSEGDWLRGVDFTLNEPLELHGRVLGVNGAALKGAAVFVRGGNGQVVDRFSFVTSDGAGRFTYTGLSEGSYRVMAKKDGNVSDFSKALQVGDGLSPEVEVQLAEGTMLLVSVVDRSGSELRPKVSVRDRSGEEWTGILSLEEVMLDFGKGFSTKEQRVGPLPRGKYRVVATLEDGRTARKNVTLSGTATRKLRIRLK